MTLATMTIAVFFPIGASATVSFSVSSQASLGCLDIQGPEDQDGAVVSTSHCNVDQPTDSQVWIFQEGQLLHRAGSGRELCLDIPENNRANGQRLQMWTCAGSEQQRFVFEAGQLKTVDRAMCLDLCAEDGRSIQLWQCDGFSANQRWFMNRVGIPDMTASVSIKQSRCMQLAAGEESGTVVEAGYCDTRRPNAAQTWLFQELQIVHRTASGSELCLDVPENDRTNGRQLQVWACNGSEQQKFLNDNGQFKTVDGQKCLDLRQEDQTAVQLYDCLVTENQKWELNCLENCDKTTTPPPSPTTSAVSLSTAVFTACLDLTDGAEADGTLLQVRNCDPTSPSGAQVWYLRDGQVIHRTASGDELCLDVPATDGPADGVHLQVWTCAGTTNQQWRFENGVIKTAGGQHCVDLSAEDNTAVQLWSCFEGALNQEWVLTELATSLATSFGTPMLFV